jgi:hypothetical protein
MHLQVDAESLLPLMFVYCSDNFIAVKLISKEGKINVLAQLLIASAVNTAAETLPKHKMMILVGVFVMC